MATEAKREVSGESGFFLTDDGVPVGPKHTRLIEGIESQDVRDLVNSVNLGQGLTGTLSEDLKTVTIAVFVDPPAAADSPGKKGQMAFDATNLYVCIDTDTWVKVTIATWT